MSNIPQDLPPWGNYGNPDEYAVRVMERLPDLYDAGEPVSWISLYQAWLLDQGGSSSFGRSFFAPLSPFGARDFLMREQGGNTAFSRHAFATQYPALAMDFDYQNKNYIRTGKPPYLFDYGNYALTDWWVYDLQYGYGVEREPYWRAIGYDPNSRDFFSYGVEALMVAFAATAATADIASITGETISSGDIAVETAEVANTAAEQVVVETVSLPSFPSLPSIPSFPSVPSLPAVPSWLTSAASSVVKALTAGSGSTPPIVRNPFAPQTPFMLTSPGVDPAGGTVQNLQSMMLPAAALLLLAVVLKRKRT